MTERALEPRALQLHRGALSAIFLAAFSVYAQLQSRVTINGGAGWDGVHVVPIAEQMCSGQSLSGQAPFALRLGLPLLTCVTSKATGLDLINSGFLLGMLLALASLFALDAFLRMHRVKLRTSLVFCTLYLVHFMSPLRSTLLAAMSSEALTHFVLLMGLILLKRDAPWPAQLAFAVLGVAVREIMLIFPVLYCLQEWQRARSALSVGKIPVTRFLPMLAGALVFAFIVTHVTLVAEKDFLTGEPYSFVQHALVTIYGQTFVRMLFACMLAFGPLLWLHVHRPRVLMTLLRDEWVLLGYALSILVLAFAGGTDTDRFMLWLFPVLYLASARVWDEANIAPSLRALTLLLLVLSERCLWATPYKFTRATTLCMERMPCPKYAASPFPFLHFQTDNFQLLDLHPFWGTRHFIMTVVAQYLVCIAFMVWAQRAFDERSARQAVVKSPPQNGEASPGAKPSESARENAS